MSCTIQVRVDDDLKAKADNLFKDLGTDTTTAVRIFLTQAVAYNGFPFEIKRPESKNQYSPLTEEQLYSKLEKARQEGQQGNVRSADAVLSDIEKRYGL